MQGSKFPLALISIKVYNEHRFQTKDYNKYMVTMKTFNSREEWLEARTSYLGGSDIAAVLGLHPYMTNLELWEIKTGRRAKPPIKDMSAVDYGNDCEPIMRELFKVDYPQYEMCYEEYNMWLNDKYPWAHASLDGWLIEKDSGKKGVWECKTSLVNSYQAFKEKWGDNKERKIPINYYCQVLYYLMVTGFDFVRLTALIRFSFSEDKQIKQYYIDRAEVEDDIQMLATKGAEFADLISKDIKPALLLPNI